jgi:hypothetical protein
MQKDVKSRRVNVKKLLNNPKDRKKLINGAVSFVKALEGR